MINNHTITLVIPAHNEEEGLPEVLSAVPEQVDQVIVVDNCSTDGTSRVAKEYGARVVKQPLKGYGNAYRAGFTTVETDLVATADADGTYPVHLIPDLAQELLAWELDFISARRMARDRAGTLSSVLRYSGNFILSATTAILYWRLIKDSQSGMWIFRREILDKVKLTSGGMPMSQELKIEAWTRPGIRCREVDVPFSYSARRGKPKLNLWRDGFRNLLFLFARRFGIPMTGA